MTLTFEDNDIFDLREFAVRLYAYLKIEKKHVDKSLVVALSAVDEATNPRVFSAPQQWIRGLTYSL